ncbi:MAG: cation transporter [Marinicaulis sp.]|nr:cation transporter [Marinicaulis sp.]
MKSKDGDHSGHFPASANARALKISAWLTGVYFVIELAIGIYTGSIAVISDAFHTFSAVGGVLLAFFAARIARRPADAKRTFGSARAEIIGALLNGAFLFVMAIIIFIMGIMRLSDPIDLPTTPMLLAAAGGLFTEIISLKLLYGGQKGDLNMRGAFWHVVQTFVGSILIIITALVIQFTGYLAIDPLLGMAFGVVLLIVSLGIMREALAILMEGTPAHIDLKKVVRSLTAFPGVNNVHHVHAWTLTSNKHVFSAHLHVDEETSRDDLLSKAHKLLRNEFGFYFSTIQIETSCLGEDHAGDLDVSLATKQER